MPRRSAAERRLLQWVRSFEPKLQRRYLMAWQLLRDSLPASDIARILASGSPEKVVAAVASDEVLDRVFAPVTSELGDGLGRAAREAAKDMRSRALREGVRNGFNILNPRVLESVNRLNSRALKRLKEGLRESFLEHMREGIEAGSHPLTIARGLREVVGLHPGQPSAIANFERMLRNGDREALTRVWRDRRFDRTLQRALGRGGTGLSEQQIQKMVAAYRRKAIASNAATQARSAALETYRMGQRASWEDAFEKGLADKSRMVKTRHATQDSLARPEHAAMHGETVPYDEPYSNGEVFSGELSYNCRCWDEYTEKATAAEAQVRVPGVGGGPGRRVQGRPKIRDLLETKGVTALIDNHKNALRLLIRDGIGELDGRTGNALVDAGLAEKVGAGRNYRLTGEGTVRARELLEAEGRVPPPPRPDPVPDPAPPPRPDPVPDPIPEVPDAPFTPSETERGLAEAFDFTDPNGDMDLRQFLKSSESGLPMVSDDTIVALNRSAPESVPLNRVFRAADAQESVERARVAQYLRNEVEVLAGELDDSGFLTDSPVLYLTEGGDYIIMEGHHRVAANILAGRKNLRARVIRPKSVAPDLPPPPAPEPDRFPIIDRDVVDIQPHALPKVYLDALEEGLTKFRLDGGTIDQTLADRLVNAGLFRRARNFDGEDVLFMTERGERAARAAQGFRKAPDLRPLVEAGDLSALPEDIRDALRGAFARGWANANIEATLPQRYALQKAGLAEMYREGDGLIRFRLNREGLELAKKLEDEAQERIRAVAALQPKREFVDIKSQMAEIDAELSVIQKEMREINPIISERSGPRYEELLAREAELMKKGYELEAIGRGDLDLTNQYHREALERAGILRAADERSSVAYKGNKAKKPEIWLNGDTKTGRAERGLEAFNEMVHGKWHREMRAVDRDVSMSVRMDTNRAYYSHDRRTVAVAPNDHPAITVHELGHWLEDSTPEISRAAHRFLQRRWKGSGTVTKSLREITGRRGYSKDEIANPDSFFNPYVGKIYEWGSTEVVSMGLEMMYRNPVWFFEKDPDHYRFILEIIQGRIPE